MESIVTKYTDYCIVCGKPTTETHHLVFGVGKRQKSDEDGLTVPLCSNHHTQGKDRLHDRTVPETLSKIAGQLAYEKHKVAEGMTEDEARESFRKRYGVSYL